MKVRLTEKDIEVLMFLGRYKMMLGTDCRRIYKSKDYYRKRLKVLEKEKYIRRINRIYIKLDDKGTRLVKKFGYDYSYNCRKKTYISRLNEIAKIAGLTIDTNFDFVASWDMKDKSIFTQMSRKYLGKLKCEGKEIIVYYISKEKEIIYISQIINDIQKLIEHKNIIIFIENMDIVNRKRKFVFGNESTIIIRPTLQNLSIIRKITKTDLYEVLKNIYTNKEILLSNWENAQYMTNEKNYIVLMPFIDTEKLYKLTMYDDGNKKIDIITLKENKEKIKEILTNNVNIIEIDDWLGGIDESI